MRFPRDKNGKIVSKNEEGEYSKDNDVRMRVKYHDKMQISKKSEDSDGVITVKEVISDIEGQVHFHFFVQQMRMEIQHLYQQRLSTSLKVATPMRRTPASNGFHVLFFIINFIIVL